MNTKLCTQIVKDELDTLRYMIAEEFYKMASGDIPDSCREYGICDTACEIIEIHIETYLEKALKKHGYSLLIHSSSLVEIECGCRSKLVWSRDAFNWSGVYTIDYDSMYPVAGAREFNTYDDMWSDDNPNSGKRKDLALWIGDLYYNGKIKLKVSISKSFFTGRNIVSIFPYKNKP